MNIDLKLVPDALELGWGELIIDIPLDLPTLRLKPTLKRNESFKE
jgi:hypothetical protein